MIMLFGIALLIIACGFFLLLYWIDERVHFIRRFPLWGRRCFLLIPGTPAVCGIALCLTSAAIHISKVMP